jgi:predicted transcriptional regulator
MYGKVPTHAMTVNVYSLDNVLVRSFTSQVAAALWLNTSQKQVSRYIKSGKVWNKLYTFRKST